jgi:hypothetical protein
VAHERSLDAERDHPRFGMWTDCYPRPALEAPRGSQQDQGSAEAPCEVNQVQSTANERLTVGLSGH